MHRGEGDNFLLKRRGGGQMNILFSGKKKKSFGPRRN